jgi:hypothetical protein
MSKISTLIAGLAIMGTTLVTAAPRVTTPQTTPQSTEQPAAMSQASQPLPWELQQDNKPIACNLFCIQGYHCCIIKKQPTCVPETQACP